MTLAFSIYQSLIGGAIALAETLPPRRLDHEEVAMRKGLHYGDARPAPGVVWVHGASLGEWNTLRPFMRQLVGVLGPGQVLGTAMTMDGLRRLRTDGLCDHTALLPLDHAECLEPFINRWSPRLLLLSETELWPGLLAFLARRGIPVGIINARINVVTQKAANLFAPIFAEGLAGLRFVYAQSDTHAARYRRLGISTDKIAVLGSFKYDIEPPKASIPSLQQRLGVPPDRVLWTFGSTRPGEEAMLLLALEPLWSRMPAQVVIAPRHLDRVPEIEALLQARNLSYCRLGDGPIDVNAQVVLVNVLGELVNLYALSRLGFVGGSLADFGGHNVMEPAACGTAVAVGRHTRNFTAEIEALRAANAVRELDGIDDLSRFLAEAIDNPNLLTDLGAKARFVHASMGGVVARTMAWLLQTGLLPPTPVPTP